MIKTCPICGNTYNDKIATLADAYHKEGFCASRKLIVDYHDLEPRWVRWSFRFMMTLIVVTLLWMVIDNIYGF